MDNQHNYIEHSYSHSENNVLLHSRKASSSAPDILPVIRIQLLEFIAVHSLHAYNGRFSFSKSFHASDLIGTKPSMKTLASQAASWHFRDESSSAITETASFLSQHSQTTGYVSLASSSGPPGPCHPWLRDVDPARPPWRPDHRLGHSHDASLAHRPVRPAVRPGALASVAAVGFHPDTVRGDLLDPGAPPAPPGRPDGLAAQADYASHAGLRRGAPRRVRPADQDRLAGPVDKRWG